MEALSHDLQAARGDHEHTAATWRQSQGAARVAMVMVVGLRERRRRAWSKWTQFASDQRHASLTRALESMQAERDAAQAELEAAVAAASGDGAALRTRLKERGLELEETWIKGCGRW